MKNIENIINEDSFEILPGNVYLGKYWEGKICYEYRYVYTKNINMQILIDDVWSEYIVWKEKISGSDNIKIVIYLINDDIDINIEKNNISIPKELIISEYFESINKYIFPVSKNRCSDLNINYHNSIVSINKKNRIGSNKLISIITTVLNNSVQLEQTIQSVINQTYTNFEYIIKDGGSEDELNNVIVKYNDYLDKVIISKDYGIYDGMHQGIQDSNGKYVLCIGSDDIFLSDSVFEDYSTIVDKFKYDAIYANLSMYDINNRYAYLKFGSLKNIYRSSSINHPTLLLKKDIYYLVGGFDKNLKLAADADLTIKLIEKGARFYHLNKVTVIHRLGGASSSSYRLIKEDFICRFRYNPFNLLGYLYAIARLVKYIFRDNR